MHLLDRWPSTMDRGALGTEAVMILPLATIIIVTAAVILG